MLDVFDKYGVVERDKYDNPIRPTAQYILAQTQKAHSEDCPCDNSIPVGSSWYALMEEIIQRKYAEALTETIPLF